MSYFTKVAGRRLWMGVGADRGGGGRLVTHMGQAISEMAQGGGGGWKYKACPTLVSLILGQP